MEEYKDMSANIWISGDTQKIRPDIGIGGNIRKLRKANGMKQDDVVARLQLSGIDITRSTYAKIEANLMNIKVSELIALRNIFRCSYNDFFTE